MKKPIIFVLLALFSICGFAQTIDPVLLQEMGRRTDDEKIQVVVIMKSQYDRQQLGRSVANFATRAERREFVVNELKQFAEASQYDLRTSLNEMERHGMTTAPTTLWMANALCFSATKQAINDLAMRRDVQIIGLDETRYALFDEEPRPAEAIRGIVENVTKVNADDVWALGYTGQGVVVAILDSGVNYNHLDLANNLWDGGSEYPNHGYDFVNNDNDPMDDYGHGTHCAGTICGDGTAGTQTGIAPDATLMCVKVLNNSGSGSVSVTCNAIQWAVEQGCDVLNMAFGWSNSSIAERTLLRNSCVSALDAGVIAAVAAGDRGGSTSSYPIPNNITVPGSCPPPYMDSIQEYNGGGLSCAFTVGAVDQSDYINYSSSRGPVTWSNTEYGDYPYTAGSTTEFGLIRPDVCAPGSSVISTDYSNTSGYTSMSGTSMATACVSGCVSLLLSKNVNATPAEICEALEKTAYSRETGKSNTYGYGRVDVLAAINAMSAGPLSLVNVGINDIFGNIDGKLNAGESVYLHLTLKNESGSALNGVNLVLSTESEDVTINNGLATLTNMTPGQTRIFQNIFNITLSDNAPAMQSVRFAAEATLNGELLGILRFDIMVYGHVLQFQQVTVTSDSNGDGSIEAGETGTLHVVITNAGNEEAPYINGTLSSTFPHLTVNSTSQDFGTIAIGGQGSADFNVTLASTAPDSYNIDLSLDLIDGFDKHFQVDFEIWRRAITLTSNPEGAGILTGGGNYGAGQTCTITAVPSNNHNYAFTRWTLNGSNVSYYYTHNVTVTDGAEYVAQFKEIDGVSIGNPSSTNYYFPTYYYYPYSLTQQIYTASEMGGTGQQRDIASVSFFNTNYYSSTRNLTIYMVNTTKQKFESNNDWITVTEADRVYSGNVSMSSGNWATIYFNTPFTYDGSSNVALIIDDNTGSSGNGLSCRAFNTDDEQAIRITNTYNNTTNFDPLHPTNYQGTRSLAKNQVVFGNAHYDYAISASANPTIGGTVSGYTGQCFYGQPVTLTATPNPSYVFDNWIKNNNTNNPSYYPNNSFSVTESADYVANFQHLEGVSIGIATASSGYLPFYSYKYSLTQQIYTAAEMGDQSCQISNVSFYNINSSSATRDGIAIYLVHTTKTRFESNTDWIPVTTADEVFNGSITYSKGWMTIFFDRAFEYDGNSNLALVFVANSTTSGYVSCRTFPTYSNNQSINQAIRITNNNNSYDPFNLGNYTGSRESVKNEVVFGSATGNYTVTVTANPPEYGTVSGGGSGYSLGQMCTVTATPAADYCFLNWKVNGTVVSTEATYTFPVSGDMVLEANFGVPIMITATVNPEGSGTVSGAGGYAPGQTCTLTATPNEGYVFRYWTRASNGNVVSNLPTYSFTVSNYNGGEYKANFRQLNENEYVIGEPTATSTYLPDYMNSNYSLTQQIYTVSELGGARQIASVSFFNASSNYTTYNRDVVVYLVQTNKVTFNNENDWIQVTEANQVFSGTFKAAYNNWSTIYFNTPFNYNGTSNLALIVYDRTNSKVSNLSFRTCATEGSQAIRVNGDNPINTSGPTEAGTLMTEKNQIILGTPVYGYTLALSADPANGGTVSGDVGDHFYGQPVTITATPNQGYVFKSWTRSNNSNVVSYLSPTTVSITDNVEYVAHFEAMEGMVVGEPGSTNSYLPAYTYGYNYSLSQQIYTAEELNTGSCQISSVSFFNTSSNNAPLDITIYMVNTDKTAFDNMSDWISVTDDDIVFDGSVNITNGNWTTIYFNTPFSYDGSSNVALMVYDHSDSYNSEMKFRTFNTATSQAIYAFDSYAINPNNPVVVSTLLSEKNQVVFGVADYIYMVTVEADPEEGGTVSGNGGPYYYGMPKTISATPSPGYVFNNWSKEIDGNVTNAAFSPFSTTEISVTETANYVAHFQEMDGIVVGEATKANQYLPTSYYYYSLTQQIFTADEIGHEAHNISSLSFYNTVNTSYSTTRNLDIYMVSTSKSTFDSSADWITVDSTDLVFSGNVSITGNGWITIYLGKPFIYDGSSNVALIINNKTNQSTSYLNCRTFDTEGMQQAICAYRYGSAYDPFNPSEYSGTLYTEKSQIVFGIANYNYHVTASANPTEGGTANIIGNGINDYYYYGQPITLSATTNQGYAFSSWTTGSTVVSCFPEQGLSVTDSTEYVANFRQLDGILIGEPVHANSNLPSYNYNSLTEEIYTAAEMGGQSCWISSVSFFNAGTSRTRSKIEIYMVHTEKTAFDSVTDWIPVPQNVQALYNGRVVFPEKNWVTIYFATPFYYDGTSNVALIVKDNSQSYNSGDIKCRTFDGEGYQVLRIYGYNINYDAYNPSSYQGTRISAKNQVIFGQPVYNCNIFATANPMYGGWVTGDIGPHYYGQPITLTATPISGYVFTNWTKDGVVVSDYPTYSFSVTETATFVANFKQVEDDGIAIGEPVTSSYYLPTYYYYSLTQQIYTRAEMGSTSRNISSVSFYNTGTARTRGNVDIYLVHTNKTAFASTTDWVAVTEADKVFSGSINMLANDWTTINFNTVFEYDGTSNVVLIMDDNSNNYNSYINCRTFNTENENQAIRISSSNVNYDPSNPGIYEGTLMTMKNQVIFGPPSYNHSVVVTANPEEGGMVSGGGEGYFLGQLCTVTATPNEGYCFYNWTENGTVVSSEETYTFAVTGNMNLVANFGEPIMITTIVSPEESGTITGGGGYALNHSCTLKATANSGYAFTKWTWRNGYYTSSNYYSTYTFSVTEAKEYTANFEQVDNGVAIGDAGTYNYYLPFNSYYSMTQQIYTASEMGNEPNDISSVSFFNITNSRTRNLNVYMVHTEKTAFESNTDWITVTEADLVFSGSVTFTGYNWATIYFSTPFSYDGSSNIALIIDDNTNSSSSAYCRTFSTTENQAIRVSGTGTNYDPYNPDGYTGTLMAEKNQVIFGFVSSDFTVSLTANPPEGGTVSGGEGLYYLGQPCTVTATPNEGYWFYNWKRNGTIVSRDPIYTFQVMGNTDLVASFGPPIQITATANTEEGGTVTGTGEYAVSQRCTLIATPNPGYVFIKWMKTGNSYPSSYLSTYSFDVTTNAEYVAVFELAYPNIVIGDAEANDEYLPCSSYYYSLSEQIYTAEEIGTSGEIHSLSFFNTYSYGSPDLTIYMKHTNKSDFSSYSDWIPVSEADQVFSGTVDVTDGGWTKITLDTPFHYNGTSNLVLVVDNNTGNYMEIGSRVFNSDSYQSIYVNDYEDLDPDNMNIYWGSRSTWKNQIAFDFSSTQTITLTQGWNWISTYIEAEYPIALLDMLKASLGENGLQIESQSGGITIYEDGEWFGDLDYEGIYNEQMYLIEVDTECTIQLQGVIANPVDYEIIINPGWNWIGFPSSEEISITEAFAGFQPEEEDVIESSLEQVMYLDGEWLGSGFETLTPGQGFMYFSNSTETKILIYQIGRK